MKLIRISLRCMVLATALIPRSHRPSYQPDEWTGGIFPFTST